MERYISVYSEIVDGYKRTHIDLITNGHVRDRQCVEGHDYHGRVDEFAKAWTDQMAHAYGVNASDITDLGVIPSKQFNIEQSK